jgi:hypothetical protein
MSATMMMPTSHADTPPPATADADTLWEAWFTVAGQVRGLIELADRVDAGGRALALGRAIESFESGLLWLREAAAAEAAA